MTFQQPSVAADRDAFDRADWTWSVLLLVATAAYLSWLPRNLGWADESFFLYEARRIREGEAMYRDFFQFVAPLAWYVMAALYWIFGTDMATARVSMAILHGLTAVLLYLSGRAAGARRALALLPPAAYVVLCQPAWPYASPHWFSTFFLSLLLLLTIRLPWATKPRWSLALGAICALFVFTQQQKGAILAVGIGLLLLLDGLMSRRFEKRPIAALAARLVWFAGGFLVAFLPLAAVLLASAGWRPVFDDLVLYPIYEYRGAVGVSWGRVGLLSRGYAQYTWPKVLAYVPLAAMLVPLLRAFLHLLRGTDRKRLRLLTILVTFCGFSCLSTVYNSDFIHLAFIAPVAFVTLSETVDWALATALPATPSRLSGWALTIVLLVALGQQLRANTLRDFRAHPFPHRTAFGRIDFNSAWEPVLVDKLRELLEKQPSKRLFCYPFASSPYLTTGGKNPTPYQHLVPEQSPAWQMEEAVTILRKDPVPYIVAAPLFLKRSDPIARLIGEQYEYVDIGGKLPGLWLFARRDLVEDGGG